MGASAPVCICKHGVEGEACDRCLQNFDPLYQCEKCIENYIGYDTDCSMLCLHGEAAIPGKVDKEKI